MPQEPERLPALHLQQPTCPCMLSPQLNAVTTVAHVFEHVLCSDQDTRKSDNTLIAAPLLLITDVTGADIYGFLAVLQMVQLSLLRPGQPPGPPSLLGVPVLHCLLPQSSPMARPLTRRTAAAAMHLQRRLQWQHCRGGCCQPAWRVCHCLALLVWSQTAYRAWPATRHA